ncbi:MAG: YhgE/Pip family protein [Bacillus sp. (in: firmicutes)]
MKGKSFLGEWKYIFTNKKLLISIMAVMLIPVLYAGMFLWAFWDPYSRLDQVPVAIVNLDEGAELEGKTLQIGKELVENLQENNTFNFVVADKEEAYEQLENLEYYMLIEIPSNFSENATTLLNDEPQKLELEYVPNEGYNFLAGQIGETAMEKIKAAVSEQVIYTYSETIFDTVQTMADGFQDASDSADTLYDGLLKINDGTTTLKESLQTLAAKQIEFKNGVDTVYDGVGQLSSGSQELATGLGLLSDAQGQLQDGASEVKSGLDSAASGSAQLSEGINSAYTNMSKITTASGQLQEGANSLQAGLKEVNDGASDLSAGTSSLATGASAVAEGAANLNQGLVSLQQSLTPYMAALPEEAQQQLNAVLTQLVNGSKDLVAGSSSVASGSQTVNAGVTSLSEGASKLYAGAGTLSSGLGELNQGASALESGLGQLNSASGTLNSGLGQLQAGQSQVVAGMQEFGSKLGDASTGAQTLNEGLLTLSGGVTQLADGSSQLSEGANKLSEGANELSDGTSSAEEGSLEFKEALNDAAEESSSVNADDNTFDMMSAPVEVEKGSLNEVPNYGTGFAPYFLSLGLFVGALMLSIIYPLVEPAIQPKGAFSWYASKVGVMAIVGVIQALIADSILLFVLKIDVQSVPLFIVFSIVTSLVFVALIQFFVTCFANPGRFIAIIILILQLTTSAGTFPLETIPEPLQAFNAFLPMTYTVQGFKAVISSGNFDFMWQNVGILAGFILLFELGTFTYFKLKFKKSFSGWSGKEATE